MTKREQQIAILLAYANGDRTTEQTLDALDAAQREHDGPEKLFYAMIRQHDSDTHLLYAAQGRPEEQLMGIDRIVAHLMTYAGRLKRGMNG